MSAPSLYSSPVTMTDWLSLVPFIYLFSFLQFTPLMLAAREGFEGIVRYLVDHNAPLDSINHYGVSSFLEFVSFGYLPT